MRRPAGLFQESVMKFSNKARMFTGDYFLGYPCFKTVRLSEIPKDWINCGRRRFMPPPKPWTPIVDNSVHIRLRAHKLSPRGGLHRDYNLGDLYNNHGSHRPEKTLAHRASRRKARLYFTAADPDGEYNARFNPGLTIRNFS